MLYIIENESLSVTVNDFGAEMQSIRFRGKEKLWQNSDGSWDKHAPILFPFGGQVSVKKNHILFPIPCHGFASHYPYILKEKDNTSLTLFLSINDEIRALFPYDFLFGVRYALLKNSLSVTYIVENQGDEPLPFYAAGHESFSFPRDIGHYAIRFEKTEHLIHAVHDADGYLVGKTIDYGVTDYLPLPADFLSEDRTLIFPDLASRRITLESVEGEKIAVVTFPEFRNLLLWRPERAHMICIEPWLNLPDRRDAIPPEWGQRPDIFTAAPHTVRTLTRTIAYFS